MAAELTSRVEETLVDCVVGRVQLGRRDVEGHAAQDNCGEHVPMAGRQRMLQPVTDRCQQFVTLGGLLRGEPEAVWRLLRICQLEGDRLCPPAVSRQLGGGLEDHELVGPGGEAALNAKAPSLARVATIASSVACSAKSRSSTPVIGVPAVRQCASRSAAESSGSCSRRSASASGSSSAAQLSDTGQGIGPIVAA
jgi:hypothetical protein